jgi:hypothetical protein
VPSAIPETAMTLFRTYCVPLSRGVVVEPDSDLVRLENIPGETLWVEPESMAVLEFDARSCEVSDALRRMSLDEQARFDSAAINLVTAEFVALTLDTDNSLANWDLFIFWYQFPLDNPDRWGIMLSRFSSEGDQSKSSLSLALPRT